MNTLTRFTNSLLCLIALMSFTACSAPNSSLKPITADSVVVAFGDSLTAGTGVTKDQAYPALLGTQLGCTVLNEGIPGQTTSQGLDRLPKLIERLKPTHVILCYGGNDMLQDIPESTIRTNLEKMLDLLHDAGCAVVLIGVPKAALGLPRVDLYEELAKKRGLPCDNKIIREVLSHARLKSDEIHPNAEGYERIAEALADLIQQSTR